MRSGVCTFSSPCSCNFGAAAQAGPFPPKQASFVIEQFALPTMAVGEDGVERWNGVVPADRLAELQAREA